MNYYVECNTNLERMRGVEPRHLTRKVSVLPPELHPHINPPTEIGGLK